jgi:adenine-specific DNA-methyltransferase
MAMRRLNYIGSKYNLVDWIATTLQEVAGFQSFDGIRVADLFAGTGIVSHYFRTHGSAVISNDAELYSSIVSHAMCRSVYTPRCAKILEELNANPSTTIGYVTTHYSPHDGNERMFFTVENASRIDFLRAQIEELRPSVTDDEYKFLLASLLVSADAVSNVPAVYGCYLKAFKARAQKSLELLPIHTETQEAREGSSVYNQDVLGLEIPGVDVAYLDPPYNERQYSKNYFPLNIIAKSPQELLQEPPLRGKTGIPEDCFLSPFCQRKNAETAFDTLFRNINARWIVLSYSSEGLVPRETLQACMGKYGPVTVVEREYKRFKSFEYNADAPLTEYLFCLHKE